MTSLGYRSFNNCTVLAEVNYNACNMTGFTYSPSNEYYNNEDGTYYKCYPPFYNDAAITTFNIGDSVRTIPAYLCYNIANLTSYQIPRSVTSIGKYAFANCTNLTTVSFEPLVAPTIDNSYTFSGCSALTTINIPCGYSYPSYASKLSSYTGKLKYERPGYTVSAKSDNTSFGSAAVTTAPNCDTYAAELTATPKTGYHFVRWSDNVTANPYLVDMSKDTALTAYFEINKYTFKLLANIAVRGTVSNVTGIYEHGSKISIEATPNYGYHFTQWSDGSKTNARTITLVKDSTITAIFDPNTYTITCGTSAYGKTTGAGKFEYLSETTLEATPNYGYKFTKWSDGYTANPRVVRVERDSVITAEYAPLNYQVTVNVADPKMGTVLPTSTVWPYLSKVELSATPNYGYHFLKWSDGSNQNPHTITVDKDTVFTANFEENIYTITCGASANGQTTGAGSYKYLSEITLEATPNYGYKFKQWNDGSKVNPRVVRVERDSVITAEYAPLDYQVLIKTANKAMGTVSPNSAEWSYLSQVELLATPKYGYHFLNWSDGSNQNPHTITVESDTVFTANFELNTYTITIVGSSFGTAKGAGTFNYLTDTQIEAIPNHGYKFKQWGDGIADNPRILTVESDTMLSMIFEPVKYTLRTQSNDDEMGSVSPSVGKYAYLSEVEITAVPEHGYRFEQWSDGRIANPRKVVIESDTLFKAIFGVNTYSIQVTSSSMGKVTGAGEYEYMSECTLRATANYGYQFASWSDGVTSNPRKFTVTQDSIFSAVYQPVNFTIEAYSDNTKQGSVTPESQAVAYNSVATITAIGVHGYKFLRWDDGNTDNPRQITVTEDMTFIASFQRDSFNVTIEASDYGTSRGGGRITYQETVTIEAVSAYGYQFRQWSDGETANPRTIKVNDNINLSMIFDPALFTIQTQSSNAMRGQTTPAEITMAYLSSTVISAVPNYGYHFTQWNDGNTEAEREVTVTGNYTYTASFAPNTYSIYAIASPQTYGRVSAASTGTYLETIEIYAEPNDNYEFVRWSDGVTTNPRMIILTQDTAFMAVFEVAKSGYCGDNWNLLWEYDKDEKMLTISGNGTLNSNYDFGLEAPTAVQKLVIAEGVTSIGNSAFKNYTTLKHISIASTVKNVYEQAFYNCSNLEEIYCYRDKPAVAYSNTFDGIDKFSCTLHVLEPSVTMYQVATGWREFYYVESISSQTVETPISDVVTVPHTNDVEVTWRIEETAETYSVVITKNNVSICTLIFDKDGSLTGIAFAPSPDGETYAPAAQKVAGGGLRFTVTGLESATQYHLEIKAKDQAGDDIATYTANFKTTGAPEVATNLDDVNSNSQATKIIRDGHIYILRDGMLYNAQGARVE